MIPEKDTYNGKLIVIYGANNLGKSIQTRLLANHLQEEKRDILVVKYPVYRLNPTGPRINKILRDPEFKDRNIKEIDLQKLFIQNRLDFQPTLKRLLKAGFYVIAEDYVGTGIAWGVTNRITKENVPIKNKLRLIREFIDMNEGLLTPDISILLDGERFKDGMEKKHRNEDRADYVWDLNREVYQTLAKKLHWDFVKANQTIDNVHSDIWNAVSTRITD